jgi:hypothetical protein
MGKKQGDSGLRHLTDDAIRAGARDRTLPKADRRRFVTEEKFRGLRNRRKRRGKDQG